METLGFGSRTSIRRSIEFITILNTPEDASNITCEMSEIICFEVGIIPEDLALCYVKDLTRKFKYMKLLKNLNQTLQLCGMNF